MDEQKFIISFKGLDLFLCYKDENSLIQVLVNSTYIPQYEP